MGLYRNHSSIIFYVIVGIVASVITTLPQRSAASLQITTSDSKQQLIVQAEQLVKEGNRLQQNSPQDALERYQHALTIFHTIGNRKNEGLTLIFVGLLHAAQSRYDKAIEALQTAAHIAREIDDSAVEWSALKTLGDVYLAAGRFGDALETYQQLYDPIQKDYNAMTLMASQASAHTALGQYREAILNYQHALDVVKELYPDLQDQNRKNLEGTILLSLGITYARIGDDQKALNILQDALKLFQEINAPTLKAITLTTLGGMYEARNDYFPAIGLYEQALEIQAADSIDKAVTLNNLAKAHDRDCWETQNVRHHQDVAQLYFEAQHSAHEKGANMLEARILNNLGELHLHLSTYGDKEDHLNRALAFLREALNMQRDLHDRPYEWLTLSNIGQVYELQGKLQDALTCYLEAVKLLEEITILAQLEEFTVSLRAQAAETYRRIVALLVQMDKAEQAFEFSERARARALLDQLGNQRPHIRAHAAVSDLEQEYRLRLEISELDKILRTEYAKSSPNPDIVQDLETQLRKKRREYEDLLIKLKAENTEYQSLITVDPLSLKEIQALLDHKTTLLSYFVTSNKTFVFVITRNSFETVELAITEKVLRQAINKIRVQHPPKIKAPPPEACQSLYQTLIAPLKSHLNTPIVGIIPHGVLHYLPFATLFDGKRYLSDKYILFALPSATVLQYLQAKHKPIGNTILVLTNSYVKGLPPLWFAEQEAQAITSFYARYYEIESFISNHNAQAATETMFKHLAPHYSILHLAAHGQLNLTNPLFSRIVLSPDAKNDGNLEVYEVYELNLEKTALVVLSACETRLGKQSRGDDIIGLTRAFIYAGAPSVIASLWKVDDVATRDFMTAFYLHLKFSPSPAHALRAAQRITRAKYPHPYYWATFVLTGMP